MAGRPGVRGSPGSVRRVLLMTPSGGRGSTSGRYSSLPPEVSGGGSEYSIRPAAPNLSALAAFKDSNKELLRILVHGLL